MIALNANTCIFCLYLNHKDGFHIEEILRDDVMISLIKHKSKVFFNSVILPELFTEHHLTSYICSSILKDIVNDAVCKASEPQEPLRQLYSSDSVQVTDFDTAQHVEIQNDFTCKLCNNTCIDSPKRYKDKSIECSQCESWYHMICVGVKGSEKFVKSSKIPWTCLSCTSDS